MSVQARWEVWAQMGFVFHDTTMCHLDTLRGAWLPPVHETIAYPGICKHQFQGLENFRFCAVVKNYILNPHEMYSFWNEHWLGTAAKFLVHIWSPSSSLWLWKLFKLEMGEMCVFGCVVYIMCHAVVVLTSAVWCAYDLYWVPLMLLLWWPGYLTTKCGWRTL